MGFEKQVNKWSIHVTTNTVGVGNYCAMESELLKHRNS
jgi:hypothetical protein